MVRHFVSIPANEIEDVLGKLGFVELVDRHSERTFARDYADNKTIWVYSSLSKQHSAVRPLGADAIRIVVVNHASGNHRKAGKILRIETWKKNLIAKIAEAEEKFGLKSLETIIRDAFEERKRDDACIICGHEANGVTDDGKLVCTWHGEMHGDHIVMSV